MFTKQQLAVAAVAILAATPAVAGDGFADQAPGVMFFMSIPLDAKTPKQQMPALGLSFQGERAYQRVTVDTSMFSAYERMGFGPFEAVSAKWIVAGVVAAGAGVAVASKSKKTNDSLQQQQTEQAAQQQQNGGGGTVPCPAACAFGSRF